MADIKTVKVEMYDKDLRGCVNINHNKYFVKGTIADELVEIELVSKGKIKSIFFLNLKPYFEISAVKID